MLKPNELLRVPTIGNSALWMFHNSVGDDGVVGLSVSRPGVPVESACLVVGQREHTQKTMYQLAREGVLYEQWTSVLALAALRDGDIAIDIGAHVGFFSILFRLGVGPTGMIYAFEPMPTTYQRLLHNAMFGGFTNVLPLPLAVSEKSGTSTFYIDPDNEGESSLIQLDTRRPCPVNVTRLDDVFGDNLHKRPRLMKLDAEGVELSIFKGGTRFFETHAPDLVICECHRGLLRASGESEWSLRRFFDERGYACAVVNNGVDLGLDAREYYRYLQPDEESVPESYGYVFNLAFIRHGSGLFPARRL